MSLIDRLRASAAGPLVFGHRGCSSRAPENTVAAFALIVESAIEAVELDVHQCASGEIVVAHDNTLTRTAGVDLDIRFATYSEIREHDVGTWFAPEFRGQRVPLLRDVLELLGPERFVDIEIKRRSTELGRARPDGVEAQTLRIVYELGVEKNVLVSSFDPFIVRRVARLDPRVMRAVIYVDSSAMPGWLRHGGGRPVARAAVMKPHFEQATRSMVAHHHRRGDLVLPWTVDDEAQAMQLAEIGVNGIVTNRPVEIRAALAQ